MAIIKHLKRLDDTVRGAAKTMVATFDKDGNIIAGNRPVRNIPPAPTNANVGKVWTATNASEAGWRDVPKELPEGESGDEGKVLFLNDQLDPQWAGISVDVSNKFTPLEDITVIDMLAVKIGRFVTITALLKNDTESAIATQTSLFTIDSSITPALITTGSVTGASNIYAHPTNSRIYTTSTISAGSSVYFSITYITA